MTPEFERFYNSHLSPIEGGEVDHELDKGGFTYAGGISSKFLKEIGRSGPISREDAKKITYEYFWQASGCDDMDPIAAWCYCDALFNHSPRAAAKMLQKGLGVKADGAVGPQTKKAAKTVQAALFFDRYATERVRYYTAIAKNDTTQLVFTTGWNLRVIHLGKQMLKNGLFAGELEKLSWYKSERTAVNAITGAGAIGTLALFFPDIDLTSMKQWMGDPAAFKAVLGGVVARTLVKLDVKSLLKAK